MTKPSAPIAHRHRLRGEAALMVLALAARMAIGLYLTHGSAAPRYPDEQWYWRMAVSLRSGHGLVGEFGHRAERMPLYPAFLAVFADRDDHLMWARVAQWVIGAAGVYFVIRLGTMIANRSVGLWAGLIYALDPALCGSASLLLTETIFVVVMAVLWWACWPRRAVAADAGTRSKSPPGAGQIVRWATAPVAAVGAVMLRESAVPMVTLLGVWLMVVGWRGRRVAVAAHGGVILMAVALALTAWAWRNHVILGRWVMLTTRGGISLYDGVRPGATGAGDLADVKASPEVAGLSEVEWNAYFVQQSYEAIRRDPVRIVRLIPVKLARTWSPIPNAGDLQSPIIRVLFGIWYIPLGAMVLAGIWSIKGNWVTLSGLLIPAVCVSVIHSVYVGSLRYRVGAIPTLAILASLGLVMVISRWGKPADDRAARRGGKRRPPPADPNNDPF